MFNILGYYSPALLLIVYMLVAMWYIARQAIQKIGDCHIIAKEVLLGHQ